MKKLVLTTIILLQFLYSQSQETPGYEVPNFAPKTPEAAAFLKYGEYPVDMSTGVPNISIPLYTIDLGGYKLPITLDYHASGVKVTQEATWVGLGWNLNYGAQVVLSVRDGIDENNQYIDDLPDDTEIYNYYDAHPYNFTEGLLLTEHLNESRVKDVYSFSSPTANGNFYIQNFVTNDVVVFPPDSSFKVELLGTDRSNMGFKITDLKGNVYLFNNTKEISARTMTHSDYYISAWFVDKILTATNKEIDFLYQDDGTLNDYNFSQKIDVKDKRVTYDYLPGQSNSCPDFYRTQDIGSLQNRGGSTMTQSKKISEIIFNEGKSKVTFERSSGREDLLNGNSYLNILLVKQFEGVGFVVKKGYDFDYTYFNSTNNENNISYKNKRLKLDSVVDIIDGSGHSFVYSELNLPSKVSKSRDYFGYYNGVINQNLIPKHLIFNNYFSPPVVELVGSADRSVNPNYNQAGVLKEIHYPTKGWTKFNYETNQYYGIDEFEKYELHVLSSNVLSGTAANNVSPLTFESPGINNIPICNLSNQNNCVNYREIEFVCNDASGYIEFDIVFDGSISTSEIKNFYARVRILDVGGAEIISSQKIRSSQSIKISFSHLYSGSILMEVFGTPFKIQGLQFKYANMANQEAKNLYGAGLRVKNIENYDFNGNLQLNKEFIYCEPNNILKSSGKLINNLSTSFLTATFTNYNYGLCDVGNSVFAGAAPKMNSETIYSITSDSRYGIEGNTIVYKSVIERNIDGNGHENGYSIYEFSTDSDEIPFVDPAVQIQTTWKRGKLLSKSDYKIVNGSSFILRNQINQFFEDNAKVSIISGFKMFQHSALNVSEDPLNPLEIPFVLTAEPKTTNDSGFIEIVRYNLHIPWFYQKSSKITDYFYDSSNNFSGKLETTKIFAYDNPTHLLISAERTMNSSGDIVEKKYYYPQDNEMSNEPNRSLLILKNIIGIPLCIQTFNGSTKLSEVKTVYKDWGNDLLAPEFIQSSKGSGSIETRVRFNAYDAYGHPMEVMQENGTVISYLWGYNHSQPIAKIENASNAQLKTALGVTDLTQINESHLGAINGLRNDPNFANAMITTFTYKPLIGVEQIIDAKNNKTTYEYDSFGRLKAVYDTNGDKLSENDYHYRTQN